MLARNIRIEEDLIETLAEIIGTTRSRVNVFLNTFKKLGFIEYDGERPIKINHSLLDFVLHDIFQIAH